MPYKLPKFSFCAGDEKKAGPCTKDYGSGFILQDYKTERYYIRELVRRIFFVGKGRQIFNPKAYAMFLDMQELQRRLKGRGDSGGDLRV